MQYRVAGNTETSLSLLGYGCMRFTRKGPLRAVDREKADRELQAALDAGINYFDVAYNYPGCEEALGSFMAADPTRRRRMIVATKLPQFTVTKAEDFERIFCEQLRRLQTDHIDFYLMHMLTSLHSWQRLVDMGICQWIEEKRRLGQIGHIGFSYHGGREEFKRIIDAFDWEFCQIQLNYYDATSQAGLDGLHYAANAGVPVIVMEPLRGGKLVDVPEAARNAFECCNPERTPADWALRWLFDLPEVTCVLSGMNSLDQIQQNCALADHAQPNSLSAEEQAAYEKAVAAIKGVEKIGCTGCGYCLPCPQGVDIPTCFSCYNRRYSEGWKAGFIEYVELTSLKGTTTAAGKCIGCGICAEKCPQGIDIPLQMKAVSKAMEGPLYKIVNRAKGIAFKSV